MSRNSKNATRTELARKFAKVRKGGGRTGRSAPKHGKKAAWWQRYPSYALFAVAQSKSEQKGSVS